MQNILLAFIIKLNDFSSVEPTSWKFVCRSDSVESATVDGHCLKVARTAAEAY